MTVQAVNGSPGIAGGAEKRTTFHGTFVTGLYGMNVPYPGFGRAWGLGHRS
jgi:hypothetical protein